MSSKTHSALNSYPNTPEQLPSFFKIEDNTFRIGRSPLRIDVLNKAPGIEFESCYRRKKVIKLDGINVNIISKQDLIKSKLAAGRDKDIADIAQLKRIK
jgi:predicted nucleotidyltransferase